MFSLKRLTPLAAMVIFLGFFTFLFVNRHRYPVPNTDLIAYVEQGWSYLDLKLPQSIHPPPAAPVVIDLAAKFMPRRLPYPELSAAHLINISLYSLSLLLIFRLIYPESPLIALAVVTLLATNKNYLGNGLNITNEIYYGFLQIIALICYRQKRYRTAYLLAGLSFLARYESLALIGAMAVADFIRLRRVSWRPLLLALVPVLIWLLVLNFHSTGHSLFQNAYLNEISYSRTSLPNPEPFKSFFSLIFDNNLPTYYYRYFVYTPSTPALLNFANLLFSLIVSAMLLVNIFYRRSPFLRLIFLTAVFHFIFLSLFPAYSNRYAIPVLWIIYLSLLVFPLKKLRAVFTIGLLLFNFGHLFVYSPTDHFNDKSEYRLVADWFNRRQISTPVEVLIYEPHIIDYFNRNPQVSVYRGGEIIDSCRGSSLCVAETLYRRISPDTGHLLFVVTTANAATELTSSQQKYIPVVNGHITTYQNFENQPARDHLILIATLGDASHWAKIYQYLP